MAVFITLTPIILLLTRSELKPPLRVLLYFLITKFIIELIKFHLASNKMNSLLMGNLYILLSLLFTCGIFYTIFLDGKTKTVIKGVASLYTLIFIIDFIYSNKDVSDFHFIRYAGISLQLRSGIILTFCLIYYWELIQELYLSDISRSAVFFTVCAIFVLHSVLLFTTLIYNTYFRWENIPNMKSITIMPYIFEILFSIIVSIGVIRYRKVSYK